MLCFSSRVLAISLLSFLLYSVTTLGQHDPDGGLQGIQLKEISASADKYIQKGQKVYRLFAELEEGYRLQAVYGNETSPLIIGSDGPVVNLDGVGVKTGDRLKWRDPSALVADSWVTIGVCSPGMVASLKGDSLSMTEPYSTQDLLVSGTELELFSSESDQKIMVMDNGAWMMLDGMEGIGPTRVVCIAQIVTTGSPIYRLNLQLIAPDGSVEQWVHSNPSKLQFQSDHLSSDHL